MKRIKLLQVLLLAVALPFACLEKQAHAQPNPPPSEWDKSFGGPNSDWGFSGMQTRDGGYIVTGETFSFPDHDVFNALPYGAILLVKMNPSGTVELGPNNQPNCLALFGGDQEDIGYSVQQTSDDGYIIAGSTRSFNVDNTAGYILKTDAACKKVWDYVFDTANDDWFKSVQQTDDDDDHERDDGYIAAGRGFYSKGDAYVVKVDPNGRGVWGNLYFGGKGHEEANAVIQTRDGCYVIVGETDSTGDEFDNKGFKDVYLVKLDTQGNELWHKNYGDTGNEIGYAVQQTNDSGFIIAGETSSFGAQGKDAYIVKTDEMGTLKWEKHYGGRLDDLARSVWAEKSCGYVVAGETSSFGAGSTDAYVLGTWLDGSMLWESAYGGNGADAAYAVQQTLDRGHVIVGSFASTRSDVYLIKLPPWDAEGPGFFIRSNSNGDCALNLTDAVYTLTFLFLGGSPPPCQDAADADDNGFLNLTDAVYTLRYLFLGGPAPPPPFPNYGIDPTPDELGCVAQE